MTVIPFPQPFSNNSNQSPNSSLEGEKSSVMVLKELIYSLQKEQTKIQDLLSSLGFALRSFSNLNQFLELTPLMAARVTDAVGGSLILYDDEDRVRLEQIHCQNHELGREVRRALEKVIYNLNTTTGKIVSQSSSLVANLLDESIVRELSSKTKVYGTPVIVKNVEQGRLYVFSNERDYEWTPTRRKLVQLVADQTAVAIANHDLTVKLRSKERQDRELEIASEIQVRLLPTECPQIQGVKIAAKCQTANRVGGDYYDFIPTNYDQIGQHEPKEASLVPWSIVIGDVMGKGVPAGLIMTMTRGMLRAEVLNRHSPARIMQHLNRVMYADLENSHRFVSMFYSEYNPQTRQLSFTNAAHNPPLWWTASSQKLQKLDTWGMLIGLDMESEYEDDTVTLNSGDIIMYYTDGFTDAVNANGDRFDEENLRDAFQWGCENLSTTDEILEYLFERVEKFMGQSSSSKDDMTLIIMKVC
ncbi:Serine phosphatase RsbU, regulator of sigma subunit [Hyella patelloides LEGE 07179]|uniref:Serine phosphatase RsbU, regulator of sigma subunit n=1 Tax=Hyella patelloides LEGE 07179 TaxID=945734 RepID=A0A563W0Z1_9CYAN|nr:PP2C family protein-serine/threonine phosphatase [Hyella patelloides]VEP17330.1 Serine phosphatase RsbU, regulator of sigma subunit [Hyella patelloides LEGE 07179]